MAVSTQEQKLLIKLVISTLGIAPGYAYLPVVEKVFQDLGHNFEQTATALASLPQFQARYPAGMTGEAFASMFLAGMGLQADAPLHRLAADLFNAGTSPQQIILAAVQALDSPTLPPQYAAAHALLENKAQVAYYHAQILGRTDTDFTALAKVLDRVTEDPASVEAAKLVLSPPPASGGGGGPPPFAVTKGVGDIASIIGAGTQISVAEAGGTFTFTSSGGVIGTATVVGPLAGIAVPTGSTLSISSALASGKAFSGAGTALVVAQAGGEDLTTFTGTGAGAFALTSGQNYTLTAAQAAIGRIGTTGAPGTLTDPGTTTVRDTLAALGGGVAATLKAHGADSVIASTTVGANISGIAVAGIDSIVLVAGNYTLTAAQAALVDGTTGSQTLTLTTLASGVLAATIETFVLGNFANSVTLGATTQNVSAPIGTSTTLAIAGTAPTGVWLLRNDADVLVATHGANISGVNGGSATTAENLDITGTVSLTQAQHGALTSITGATGVARITTGGTVTGKDAAASVAGYELSSIASNTFDVAANKPGVNLTGAIVNATTVNLGGKTASGTWSLGNSGDVLQVTDGANFAAVNGGSATTAEGLVITGAGTVTMTVEQHKAMVFSAASTSNTVQIASAGNFTAQSSIENYILFGTGANNVTLPAGSAGANLSAANGGAGASATVTIGGNTVTGTWALDNIADTIVASTGANISGVNGGAATTAENLTLTGGIIMTRAQHEGITSITATGASDFVTVTDGGAVTARAGVETYTVSGGGANNVKVLAGTHVNGVASNATTVNVGGNTVTGIYTLANAADVLEATNGANIAGAGTSTVEQLALTGAITMTAAQYNNFNTGGITAAGGSDRIILTTALSGGQVLNAAVESFTLAAANNSVALGAAQSIDAQALTAGQTLGLAGTFAANVSLSNGNLSSSAAGNLTVTGGTGANTIALGAGNDTVNAGDGNDVITGGAGVDTLNGEGGDDSFLYASLGEFITSNQVVDQIDGGSGTDVVFISGAITLTTASDLRRMTSVEQIKAQTQSASARSHSIVANSDTLLSGVTTIDLSGDTNGSSSSNIDLRSVTQDMALKGVGAGTNTIIGGTGVDTLVGGNGADSFHYYNAASFISETGVVDSIDGGGGTDTVQINSAFSISSTQSLARITNVEVLRAEAQASARTYALTFLSDANLGSISKIDLEFDQGSGSTASIDISGASRAMTVNGVKNGTNKIFAGQGADILKGGAGTDYFFFNSAAHAAGDTVTGGAGSNYVFFASTAGETLQITNNFTGITSYWITTGTGGPGNVVGTTSENIDASAYTLGNLVLNGSAGNNKITGGAGHDSITGNGGSDVLRGGAGNDTYDGLSNTVQFEATATANGQDRISTFDVGSKLDFTLFLGGAGSVATTAVNLADPITLLLNGADNIGVRYGGSSVSAADITTSTTGAAGKIALADNGKAVVLAFNALNASDTINAGGGNGGIYYIVYTDPGAGTDFQVALVGNISGGPFSVASMATAVLYI